MKTINFFRSKLFALALALMASVSSFAYDEMPDFQVDGLYYNFLEGDNVEVTHPYRPEMPTEGTSTTAIQDLYDDYAELTELTIPSTISYEGKVYNVIRIGYAAFDQCNLTYVDIPSSIKTIGVGAFSNCSSLTSITLKEGLEHIEGNAFADCRLLETITFPNSLKTVGSYAFSFTAWYNNQPNGGVYAGNVFYKYKGDIPENTSFVIKEGTVSISPDAFIKENRRIDYGLVAVAIPNSVEIIGEYAFSQCRALRSVNIPNRVTTIESYAFSYCKSLTSVTSEIVEPLSLPSDVFFNASVANATLYVPAESVEAYKNADQWKDFGQILPIEPTSYKSQWCDTWNILYYNQNKTPVAQTWQYTLGQDTIIEGKTYTAVNRHWTIDPENTEEYVASVRFTNNDKVYVYYDNTEYLLYDFNVQVDDSVEVFAGINDYHYAKTYKGRVFDISYSENGAKVYKISVPISTYDDGYVSGGTFREVTWIEGIGNALTGLLIGSATEASNEYIYNLLCAYKGDELMLETDHYWFNIYGCEYNSDSYEPRFFEELQRTECSLHTTGVDSTYLVSCDRFVRYVIKDKLYWWDIYTGSFFRETKDQIILSFPHGGGEECVLYDFSLEIGDTLPVMQYDEKTRGMMFRVVDVSMVTLLDGKKYKKWTLACGYEYIEKIGAINGKGLGNYVAFGPNADAATYLGSPLVCASRNGKILYQMDDAEMEQLETECLCEYNAEQKPEDLFPTLWGLQRTDIEEHTTGDGKAYLSNFEEYVPTQMNGKLYLSDGRNYLREENNQVLFCCPDFEIYEDIVLYDWTLEIGDTLPHNKSTVHTESDFIVTNVSTVTLLDGKKYKKWTLACGYEYIEGIGAINGEGYGHYLCLQSWMQLGTYIRTSLVCATRNGQLLYQMDDTEMERLGAECLCDYNRGPRKDNAKNGKIGGRPTPTQWNMLEVDLREMENSNTILRAETFSYTLENDSIVTNGKTFYQLARQSTKDTATTKSFVGALHFSEDEGNRVYFLCDGEEYVLYDFTAEPGDTIEIFAGINNYPQETTYSHVVRDKDTLENGACRMFLEVVFPDESNTGENTEKVWLAGLGSVDGIIHNATKQTRDAYAAPSRSARSSETHTSIMLCAWREDSCLYTTDHPDYDNFGCVYNQDPTSVSNTPSPMTDCQKLLRDGHLLIIYEGKTYNVLGMPIQR